MIDSARVSLHLEAVKITVDVVLMFFLDNFKGDCVLRTLSKVFGRS